MSHPRTPGLAEDGPSASPVLQHQSPPVSPLGLSCPVSRTMPQARGSRCIDGQWWLEQADAVTGPSGAQPSAALGPLPRRALLEGGGVCQEEVGADGFPQAQADGRVLVWWGCGLREQEGAVRGQTGQWVGSPGPRVPGGAVTGAPVPALPVLTCQSGPS